MSLWLFYRNKDGRRKWMSVGIPCPLTIIGLSIALLLPFVQWIREMFR